MSIWVAKNGKTWRGGWTIDGETRRMGIGAHPSRKVAMAHLLRYLSEHGIHADGKTVAKGVTLGQWLDTYKSERTDIRPETLAMHMTAGDYLIDIVGRSALLAKIGPEHARQVIGKLRREPGLKDDLMAPDTIRRHVVSLHTIFEFARHRAVPLIESNPFAADSLKAQGLKLAAQRVRDWKAVELPQFWKMHDLLSDDTARHAFLLCRLAGLRRLEARALRWEHFNWHDRFFTVYTREHDGRRDAGTKQHDRSVPMEPALYERMLAIHAGSNDEGPCPRLDRYHVDLVTKARIEAGIDYYGSPLHALRKSLATDWFHRWPNNKPALAQALGDTVETLERYYVERYPNSKYGEVVQDMTAQLAFVTHQSTPAPTPDEKPRVTLSLVG
jgi:integrase